MNRSEALNILGLPAAATEDEIKKKFRQLSKEKHPDKNPECEEEYKQISAAFTFLKTPQTSNSSFQEGAHFNINDFFKRHATRSIYKPPPINISISLSFNESVLGCQKHLSFDREAPCTKCSGLGNDRCTSCNGRGANETTSQHGNMFFVQQANCTTCQGKGHHNVKCVKCNGMKTKKEHIEVDVNIPGGVINGQIIKIPSAGNSIIDEFGLASGDVLLQAMVIEDNDMKILNGDVISTISISLYEALKGIKKKVRTVKGDKTIMVKAGSRHNNQIKLSNYGVNGAGSHVFTIEVSYPDKRDALIEFLENYKE